MIELRFEWQEAPWLPIRSHARTWARLEIRVGDACATEALHLRSKSTHEGVSLPLLPLAEWIVANWWYLLEECPLPGCGESARLAIGARERAWFERHNLLAAREGYALPDLTLSRVDDGRVQVQFAPDPGPVGVFGVQFIRGGAATVKAAALAAQLQNLLDAVADRLDGCDDADAVAFVESVEARRRMVGDDALLCARAATLGLDGADPEAVPDTLADVLVDEMRDLPRGLVSDLLDHLSAVQQGHDPASLRAVAQGLREARMVPDDRFSSALGQARERLKAPLRAAKEGRPYEVGWRLARACREQLYGLPPTLVGRSSGRGGIRGAPRAACWVERAIRPTPGARLGARRRRGHRARGAACHVAPCAAALPPGGVHGPRAAGWARASARSHPLQGLRVELLSRVGGALLRASGVYVGHARRGLVASAPAPTGYLFGAPVGA
jgi:hypothetical protein